MNRTFDLILFDLDGTLIETAPEICRRGERHAAPL
jgi:beta-phosphoglucomutase-like phosphatase (HAD superfamily)